MVVREMLLCVGVAVLWQVGIAAAAETVEEDQVLYDMEPVPNLAFGSSIAVSGTPEIGTWAVIGEPGDVVDELPFAGSASMWVYTTVSGGRWLPLQKLYADHPAANSRMGSPVAMDGEVVAVGAPTWGTSGNGAVYVYRYSHDTLFWEFEQRLTPTLYTSQSNAGVVDVSGDVLVISAYYTYPAATFVYRYDHDTSTWEKEQDLPVGGNTRGVQIAVSGDVIATQPILGGTLKLWRYSEGTWAEEDDLGRKGNFDLAGDALLVGDTTDSVNGMNAGAATVYRFDGEHWSPEQTLRASDGEAGDGFGGYVRLVEGRALIVALNDMDGARSAYVFDYDGSRWRETEKLVSSDAALGDQFGIGLAAFDRGALIGAYSYDRIEPNEGVVYAYNVAPEPGAAALGAAALLAVAAIRRSRKRGGR